MLFEVKDAPTSAVPDDFIDKLLVGHALLAQVLQLAGLVLKNTLPCKDLLVWQHLGPWPTRDLERGVNVLLQRLGHRTSLNGCLLEH